MSTAGYSGTPLEKKLGMKDGSRVKLVNAPENYSDLFQHKPDVKTGKGKKDLIHYFTKSAAELNRDIKTMRKEIEENGMIWISWPKKASKIPTDVDEGVVRAIALKNGLVDVKVCAIDETWSGLKLVIRLKDRK